jgi:uncharacterized protein YbjT (DUF2867 family)
MAQQKFLVTGATGDTGGYTVEQLLERGHAVRALAHREDDRSKRLEKMGAEVVIGDLLKFNDVRATMRGVRGAYFCYPIRPGILQATAYFAQAAKEAGLECVVNMSQKSAREDALSHAAQDHWLSEQVFDWSGITATHLRRSTLPNGCSICTDDSRRSAARPIRHRSTRSYCGGGPGPCDRGDSAKPEPASRPGLSSLRTG